MDRLVVNNYRPRTATQEKIPLRWRTVVGNKLGQLAMSRLLGYGSLAFYFLLFFFFFFFLSLCCLASETSIIPVLRKRKRWWIAYFRTRCYFEAHAAHPFSEKIELNLYPKLYLCMKSFKEEQIRFFFPVSPKFFIRSSSAVKETIQMAFFQFLLWKLTKLFYIDLKYQYKFDQWHKMCKMRFKLYQGKFRASRVTSNSRLAKRVFRLQKFFVTFYF